MFVAPATELIEAELRSLVEGLEPGRLTTADASALLERVIAVERLCAAARVLLAPRAAESDVWRDAGERSAAGWLARASGTTVADAQRTIDTGQRVADLAATERALRAGEFSVGQAHDVSSVVHLGRHPTAHQVTALQARDGVCQALGCSQTRRLERDHERDWSRTHRTALADLVDHCRHHHALKTRRNWRLVPGHGRRPMVPPGHPDHPDRRTHGEQPRRREHDPP